MVKNTSKVKKHKKVTKSHASVKPAKAKSKRRGLLFGFDKKLVGASLVVLALLGFLGWRFLPAVAADAVLWSNGVPVTLSNEDLGADTSYHDSCRGQAHGTKAQVTLLTDDPNFKTDCLLGSHDGQNVYTHSQLQAIAYQPLGSSVAYRTTAACAPDCIYLPIKDTLIRVESNNSISSGRIAIYNNFTSRLQLVDNGGNDKFYQFDASNPVTVSDFSGQPNYAGYVRWMQRSTNERWLVMDFVGSGLFRVDLNSSPMSVTKFSDWQTSYLTTPPTIEFDVTDDGLHVAVFGTNSESTVYDLTGTCGNTTTSLTETFVSTHQTTACPRLILKAPLDNSANNTYMPNLANAYQPIFNATGNEILFYGSSADGLSNRLINLQAIPTSPSPTPSPSGTPTPSPTTKPTLPDTKDQCKNDGWKQFTFKFKNQGDCVSAVTGK
jgi:hypothetical protein